MDNKIYIGGLSEETTEEILMALFAEAGTVKSVHVATDRDTGRSKGFGFVEMSSPVETDKAIELFHGREVDGHKMTVTSSRPREQRNTGNSRNNFGNKGFGGGNFSGRGGWGANNRRGGVAGGKSGRKSGGGGHRGG
jgi:RNA recognition motif-containing protein